MQLEGLAQDLRLDDVADGELAEICEEGFKFAGEFDYAPANADEAIQNYEMVLNSLGELCAEFIAPRAEDVDREGNVLNQDGTVTRAKGIAEAIEKLGQAEVMGFTLPHRFGGLNFPTNIAGAIFSAGNSTSRIARRPDHGTHPSSSSCRGLAGRKRMQRF